MGKGEIPEDLRRFIFDYIDSVEQLEVLLFLRLHRDQSWTKQTLSNQLRSSSTSVNHRLSSLDNIGVLEKTAVDTYRYKPHSAEIEQIVDKLADTYKIIPHKIFELIFSPLKKARHFAEAFMVSKPSKKEPEDG